MKKIIIFLSLVISLIAFGGLFERLNVKVVKTDAGWIVSNDIPELAYMDGELTLEDNLNMNSNTLYFTDTIRFVTLTGTNGVALEIKTNGVWNTQAIWSE